MISTLWELFYVLKISIMRHRQGNTLLLGSADSTNESLSVRAKGWFVTVYLLWISGSDAPPPLEGGGGEKFSPPLGRQTGGVNYFPPWVRIQGGGELKLKKFRACGGLNKL